MGLENVQHLIPLFHLNAHRDSCLVNLNVRSTKGCGLVVGETAESLWAGLGVHNKSWRQMGSGERTNSISHALFIDAAKKNWNLCEFVGFQSNIFI